MAKYNGLQAVVTNSDNPTLLRWSSNDNTVRTAPPLQPDAIPWVGELPGGIDYRAGVFFSDTGAWAVDPFRSELGFYYAPYTTGVFSLVSSAASHSVAVFPGGLVDSDNAGDPGQDLIVSVIAPGGVLSVQNIKDILPADVYGAGLVRVFYCPTGENAGRIAICVGFLSGGNYYFLFSDLVTPGNDFTFSSNVVYAEGVTSGATSAGYELAAGAACVAIGDPLLFASGFNNSYEEGRGSTVYCRPYTARYLDRGEYQGVRPGYRDASAQFSITSAPDFAGRASAVVSLISETDYGDFPLPVTLADFGGTGIIDDFYFWSSPYTIPAFWADNVRTVETVELPEENAGVFSVNLTMVAGQEDGVIGYSENWIGSISPDSPTFGDVTGYIYSITWEGDYGGELYVYLDDIASASDISMSIDGIVCPLEWTSGEYGLEGYLETAESPFVDGVTYTITISMSDPVAL